MLHCGYFETALGLSTVGRCSFEVLHARPQVQIGGEISGSPLKSSFAGAAVATLRWPASFYRICLSTLLQPRGLYLNRLAQTFGPQPHSGLLNRAHEPKNPASCPAVEDSCKMLWLCLLESEACAAIRLDLLEPVLPELCISTWL